MLFLDSLLTDEEVYQPTKDPLIDGSKTVREFTRWSDQKIKESFRTKEQIDDVDERRMPKFL